MWLLALFAGAEAVTKYLPVWLNCILLPFSLTELFGLANTSVFNSLWFQLRPPPPDWLNFRRRLAAIEQNRHFAKVKVCFRSGSASSGLTAQLPQNPMPSAALVSFDQAPIREGIWAFQTNDCQCIRALGQIKSPPLQNTSPPRPRD